MTGGDPIPAWMQRVAAATGLLIGIACALALLLQGIPENVSVETTLTTTSTSSKSSGGCPRQCKKPRTTVAHVTVESHTQGDPGAGSALEKVLDNDAGITVLRLLLALVMGMITAFATLRLLTALRRGSGPDDGVTVERPDDASHGGGGARRHPEGAGVVTWEESSGTEGASAGEADTSQTEQRSPVSRKSRRFAL
jgi:hypothetical protein